MRLHEAHILGAPLKPAAGLSGVANSGTIALLTVAVILIHGYHPFAEDAAIYVAGLRKLADPSLYQHDAAFVLASTHLSLFAQLGAFVLRTTRIPLDYLLLLTHLASIFLFLLACLALARRIFASSAAQWTAVLLAAALFTLPLAGTTLMLMDPYVTARSFSTPLSLFALAAALDRRWIRTALLLTLTALIHPLMAFYAGAFIVLFTLIDLGRTPLALTLACLAVIACGAVHMATLHLPISPAWRQAVLSRSHLFPSEWTWFECLGLAIPLLCFAGCPTSGFSDVGEHSRGAGAPLKPAVGLSGIARGCPIQARGRLEVARFMFAASSVRTLPGKLCLTALILGTSGALAAFLFVHPSSPGLLARLQLLRAFHMIYLVGIILLGGLLGHLFMAKTRRRWIACAILITAALAMFITARLTYPASGHIELPGLTPRNPWQQAFIWIRSNTPANAVFAADPDLVLLPGEDAQSFRVMTGRSLLADYKDEGVAAVFPELAPQWAAEYNAQRGIDQLPDT